MTLSQRLKALQQSVPVEVEDLSHLTLRDLEDEVITYGNKYNGLTHNQAWPDQEWCQFMLSRYGNSTKRAHRRTIRFIELKIEHHEQNQIPIPRAQNPMPVSQSQTPLPVPKTKALAKAKGYPLHREAPAGRSMPSSLPDPVELGDEVWELSSEMYVPETTMQTPLQQDPDFLAMRDRLLFMENALQRVIQHLDREAIQADPALNGSEECP